MQEYDPLTPLFLYYAPHNIAHAPLEVPDRYAQKLLIIDDHRHHYVQAMVDYLVGNLTN